VATFAVLIAGYVDAIYTLGGVLHAFAPESVLFPFAHLQSRIIIGWSKQLDAESVAHIISPVALEVGIAGDVSPVATGLSALEVAQICAQSIYAQSRLDGIGIVGGNDSETCRIDGKNRSLVDAITPRTDIPYGESASGLDGESLPLAKAATIS